MKLIATALLAAKRNFTPALKDKTNPAFRSKYADLGACFEAVDEPCMNAGIVLYQETSEDATGVTVETVFLHESGEFLRCGKLHVPASKQDPQGYGSALTYARRYSLLTACGIAPEDDDGNAASKPAKTLVIPASPKTEDLGIPADRLAIIQLCAENIKEHFAKDNIIDAYGERMDVTDGDEVIALNNMLPSNIRSALKTHHSTLQKKVVSK